MERYLAPHRCRYRAADVQPAGRGAVPCSPRLRRPAGLKSPAPASPAIARRRVTLPYLPGGLVGKLGWEAPYRLSSRVIDVIGIESRHQGRGELCASGRSPDCPTLAARHPIRPVMAAGGSAPGTTPPGGDAGDDPESQVERPTDVGIAWAAGRLQTPRRESGEGQLEAPQPPLSRFDLARSGHESHRAFPSRLRDSMAGV